MHVLVLLGVLAELLVLLRVEELLRLGVDLLQERGALVRVHHAVQEAHARGEDPRVPVGVLDEGHVAHDVARVGVAPFGDGFGHLRDQVGEHVLVLHRLERLNRLGAQLGEAVVDGVRSEQQHLLLLGLSGEKRDQRGGLLVEARHELVGVLLRAVVAHERRAVAVKQLLVVRELGLRDLPHDLLGDRVDVAGQALDLDRGLLRLLDDGLDLLGGDAHLLELLLHAVELLVDDLGVGADGRIGLGPGDRVVVRRAVLGLLHLVGELLLDRRPVRRVDEPQQQFAADLAHAGAELEVLGGRRDPDGLARLGEFAVRHELLDLGGELVDDEQDVRLAHLAGLGLGDLVDPRVERAGAELQERLLAGRAVLSRSRL